MKIIKGVKISPGVAIGPIYYFERYKFPIPKNYIKPEERDGELVRLKKATTKAASELSRLRELVLVHLDEVHAKMIDAQLMVLTDEEVIKEVETVVQEEQKNVTWAYFDIMTQYEEKLEKTLYIYHKERYIDLRDVKKRVIHHLSAEKQYTAPDLTEPSIFVSKSVSPSDMIHIHHVNAIGIITEIGGFDSHSGILARAFRIPYLSNVLEVDKIKSSEQVILDADEEKIVLDADKKVMKEYEKHAKQFSISIKKSLRGQAVHESRDGLPFHILMNAGFLSEVESIEPSIVQGIGLFRTEYQCIESNSIPDEDDQFEAYSKVIKNMNGLPVTFRTFDFGRDKFIEMLDLEMFRQDQLFDDWGGISFCLENPSLLSSQLRAFLRSSVYGSIQIMLPMVSSVDEVLKCKEILRDVQIELREEGTAFSEEINLGAMIETKDVMRILDDLAREVDFFSIGTNDLSLFLIGSERKSSLIKNHYHPVMFQAISKIVESAKRSQIPVNVCGEMGSDPYALIGLVAVGIRSVSVSVSALQQVAEVIRNISIKDAELIAEKILSADNALEIYTMLNKFYKMNVEPDNAEVI